MRRLQKKNILKDLKKKMVFIVGPRQVGKTWLAKEVAKEFSSSEYLNYDSIEDREIILKKAWISTTDLLILDELHKMEGWKSYLKGVYDTKPEGLKILVTGSARLDTFRYAGDALSGRFFVHRLMPFSLAELKGTKYATSLENLILLGGFPEPFLSESEIEAKRWRNQYIDGLIRSDILDFEKIHDFKAIQLVLELLRRRVGSPVSYTSIAEDVHISSNTVKKYIEIFESLFILFRVTPYSKNIARSIIKEPKIYFYDSGMVIGDEGVMYENFVAISLLKSLYALNDYCGEQNKFCYLRTKEGKETDFCVVDEHGNKMLLEAKKKDREIDRNLKYFCEKYDLKGIQVVKELQNEYQRDNIEVRKAQKYLEDLYL